MVDGDANILADVARLADTLGPALQPTHQRDVVASITAVARRVFRAEACSIALVDAEDDELVFYVASGGSDDIVGQRIPMGEGIAGYVVATGQMLAVADVSRDPRFSADLAQSLGYVPRSIIALPLATERGIVGVLEVLDADTDAADTELLAMFAQQAALAVESATVFAHLGETLLSAAARASDDHDLTVALQDLAGQAHGPDAETLRLAACFHDLSQLGPTEVEAATQMLESFLRYVRKRSGVS